MNNSNQDKTSDNINFFLTEKVVDNDNDNDKNANVLNEIQNIMDQIDEEHAHTQPEDLLDIHDEYIDMSRLMYFMEKDFYGDDELYYNQEYTIKDLLKICEYYGIDKNIKTSKCKKQDIISTLVYFENMPENAALVKRRNLMWAYMHELTNDIKMKKYVIWT